MPDIATYFWDMLGGYLGNMLHKFDDLPPTSSAAGPPGVRLRIAWTHSTCVWQAQQCMRRGDGKRKPQIFPNRMSVVPIPLPPLLSRGLLKRASERGRGRPNGAIKGNEEMAAAGLPLAKASAYPGGRYISTPAQVVSSRLSLPSL